VRADSSVMSDIRTGRFLDVVVIGRKVSCTATGSTEKCMDGELPEWVGDATGIAFSDVGCSPDGS